MSVSKVVQRWSRAATLAVALQSFTLASRAQLCPPGTPANDLCWLGGRVVHDPKLYLVYWGWGTPMNDPSNFVPITDTFARGIGATRALAIPTQYYDDYLPGSFYIPNPADIVKGVWYDNTNPLPADPWNGSYQNSNDRGATSAWDDWGAPPGGATLSGDPDAAWGPNRYDIFVKLSDGTVEHKWRDAGAHGWDNWGPVGGGVSSFPASSRSATGAFD